MNNINIDILAAVIAFVLLLLTVFCITYILVFAICWAFSIEFFVKYVIGIMALLILIKGFK